MSCVEDQRCLEDSGVPVPLLVVPPVAPSPVAVGIFPVRPPRILIVGSETVANLDGLRWFRRRVLPRIRRAVPSARLRLVGEAGRHVEPGPDLDRVGWLDRLEGEYEAASIVVLPLRLGGGVRRRAVEALAHGKAFATTAVGAYGLGLEASRDAVIAPAADELAKGVIDVLTHDRLRESYERRAREVVEERFAPGPALAPLLAALGGSDRDDLRPESCESAVLV